MNTSGYMSPSNISPCFMKMIKCTDEGLRTPSALCNVGRDSLNVIFVRTKDILFLVKCLLSWTSGKRSLEKSISQKASPYPIPHTWTSLVRRYVWLDMLVSKRKKKYE